MARGKVNPRYSPKRAGGDDDGPDPNAWLGTYGDMITLLMAFFVMLYAISQVDQMKFQAFVQGLSEPFGNQVTVGMLEGSATLEEGVGSPIVTADGSAGVALVPPDRDEEPEPTEAPTAEPSPEPTAEPADERAPSGADIAAEIAAALEAAGLDVEAADVRPDERGIVISVASDDVLFPLGSATVSTLGRRVVAVVAEVIDELPNEVIVEGHTDDLPLRRRAGYDNWNLSTDRAVAVLKLLAAGGVDERRLIAGGYGEQRPRVANDSARNRSLNRRVDVVLVADKG